MFGTQIKNLLSSGQNGADQNLLLKSNGDTSHQIRSPYMNFLSILSQNWILVGIVSFALLRRLWIIGYALPVIYNVDESFCVSTSVRLGGGDLNPHIFMWPHFFFYLLFGLYGFFFIFGHAFGVFESLDQFKYLYFNDPSYFYFIGRAASAIVGAASVLILYFLAKRYRGKEVGLIGAAFLAISTFHSEYSRIALPEVTMTFFVLCTVYNAYRIYEEGKLRNYVWAGLFLGLAVSTKYNAFLVFLTIVFAHIFFVWERFGFKLVHRNFGRLFLTGIVSLCTFFLGTPFAILDYKTFLKDISFTTSASSPNVLYNSFTAAVLDYTRILFFPEGWINQLNFIGVLVIAGVVYTLIQPKKRDIIILIFPILHFLFFTEKTSGDPRARYLIPMLPFFYIFGALFTMKCIEWIAQKVFSRTSKVYQTLKVSLALSFCIPVIAFDIENSLLIEADTGNLARKWIEANIPAGSKILYTDFHTLALKRNLQSLKDFYEDIQAYTTSKRIPKEKLEAVANYNGPTYYIQELYHGWNDENRESTLEMQYLPQGVIPFDYEKFSLKFWLEREFEFAIVFRNSINRYLAGKEGDQFPFLRQFYGDVLNNSTLIKEFHPNPPRVAGYHIQIYRFNVNKSLK